MLSGQHFLLTFKPLKITFIGVLTDKKLFLTASDLRTRCTFVISQNIELKKYSEEKLQLQKAVSILITYSRNCKVMTKRI